MKISFIAGLLATYFLLGCSSKKNENIPAYCTDRTTTNITSSEADFKKLIQKKWRAGSALGIKPKEAVGLDTTYEFVDSKRSIYDYEFTKGKDSLIKEITNFKVETGEITYYKKEKLFVVLAQTPNGNMCYRYDFKKYWSQPEYSHIYYYFCADGRLIEDNSHALWDDYGRTSLFYFSSLN